MLTTPIEKQIISNMFKFYNECKLNLIPNERDELCYKHGTTVDGFHFYYNNDVNCSILEWFYNNTCEDTSMQLFHDSNEKK